MKIQLSQGKRYQRSLILVMLIFLLVTLTNSCKKDNKSVQILNPIIDAAKNWYESTYPVNSNTLALQSSTGTFDASQVLKPDWEHGTNYKRFDQQVIEVPLDHSVNFTIGLKNAATNQLIYNPKYSLSSFLLLNDKSGFKGYIMTVIADSTYLNNDVTKLNKNKYNHRDSTFTGVVFYSTPKGIFVSAWFYRSGLLINSIMSGQNSENGGLSVQSLKTNSWIRMCTDYYEEGWANGELQVSRLVGLAHHV